MPHIIRPIATIEDLAARASALAKQAEQVQHLLDLPFGGIDPRKVMAEFNELLAAAARLLGKDRFSGLHGYNLTAAERSHEAPPAFRRISLRHATTAIIRLAAHVETTIQSMPADEAVAVHV